MVVPPEYRQSNTGVLNGIRALKALQEWHKNSFVVIYTIFQNRLRFEPIKLVNPAIFVKFLY
jgi:hypothetical protein